MFEQITLPLLRLGLTVISWQGVRADESDARALLPKFQRIGPAHGVKASPEEEDAWRLYAYRPLLHWKTEDVFALHKKHGLKPNPLYANGMSRVGCMPCIMCRKAELYEIARRFPEHIERLEARDRRGGLLSHSRNPEPHRLGANVQGRPTIPARLYAFRIRDGLQPVGSLRMTIPNINLFRQRAAIKGSRDDFHLDFLPYLLHC